MNLFCLFSKYFFWRIWYRARSLLIWQVVIVFGVKEVLFHAMTHGLFIHFEYNQRYRIIILLGRKCFKYFSFCCITFLCCNRQHYYFDNMQCLGLCGIVFQFPECNRTTVHFDWVRFESFIAVQNTSLSHWVFRCETVLWYYRKLAEHLFCNCFSKRMSLFIKR